MPEISYLPVLVSGITAMVIGAVWYHPKVFGTEWMSLAGLSKADLEGAKRRGMVTAMLAAFAGSLLMMSVMDQILAFSGAVSLLQAGTIGFLVWLGFIAPVLLGSVLWENKPLKLCFINAVQYLIALIIGAAIIVMWPW